MDSTEERYKKGIVRRKMEDHSLGILFLKKGSCEIEVDDKTFGMWESDLCLIPPDISLTVLGQAGGVIVDSSTFLFQNR